MTPSSQATEIPAVRLIEAEQAPILARPHYAGGTPGPITASLAHVPEVLEATLPFVSTVLAPSAVPARTKEMVILRASALLACRYCVETHTAVALDAGLSRDEVRALRADDAAGLRGAFPALSERALLAWVDEVAAGRGPVDAEVTAAVGRHWSEPEIVELALLTGATLMLNRYCTALRLPTSPATLDRLAREGLS